MSVTAPLLVPQESQELIDGQIRLISTAARDGHGHLGHLKELTACYRAPEFLKGYLKDNSWSRHSKLVCLWMLMG